MDNVADMVNIFNDHGFTDTSTATKISFLNDTISNFCGREPWPFLETTATLAFDGTNPYSSTDLSGAPLRTVKSIVDAANNRVIQPERIENLEKSALGILTDTGDPAFYYFIGEQLRFAPIPPSSFTARMTYLQEHPEVTIDTTASGILVPKRSWMTLVFGTLVNLYDMDDDPELSVRFEQHYETRIQQDRAAIWQRQLDRPDYIVITDPDYYDYDV